MTELIVYPSRSDRGLHAGYLEHVKALGLSDRAIRDRVRIAADFLGRHPDLQAWMGLPAAERVSELNRTGAWPLVCYAIGDPAWADAGR